MAQMAAGLVSAADCATLEAAAATFWDKFYNVNQDRFFKDRHYLHREFPLLLAPNITVLEVGCGVGNTALPLAATNKTATVHSCDYSHNAVRILQQADGFVPQRMTAFVADITKDALTDHIRPHSVDIVTCVFALSANAWPGIRQALAHFQEILRPRSGTVLVRDYAAGDLAEQRFAAASRRKCLDEHFYVRGDGTRCLFFEKDQLRTVFEEAGFVCLDLHVHTRVVENRKRGARMPRRWIQGVFALPPGPHPSLYNTPSMDAQHGKPQGVATQGRDLGAYVDDVQHGCVNSPGEGDEAWWRLLPWQSCSQTSPSCGACAQEVAQGKCFEFPPHVQPCCAELALARWLHRNPRLAGAHVVDVNTDGTYAAAIGASVQLNASRVIVERLDVMMASDTHALKGAATCLHATPRLRLARASSGDSNVVLMQVVASTNVHVVQQALAAVVNTELGAVLVLLCSEGCSIPPSLRSLGRCLHEEDNFVVLELDTSMQGADAHR